ncbi:MAG: malonyl-[acyl-carrier protein] O-methyltransferase BioC [Desulfuromonadales bacterium C00003096]|nr:MAG: malonyl-[acyl-carrier protein] O-methyltransferase BioC [Desulfuromonadales bacterium C00003096]
MTAAVDSRRLRRNFSLSAERYDHHAHIQQQVVTALLQFMGPRCPTQGTFLDIGCGTGSLSYALCQRHPQLQPILSDIAHGMTLHSRSRIAKALAVDAAAEALPFADHSVDLICSSSVYQWVLDLPKAFSENARILRDGGQFAFALFGRGTLRELKTAYRQAAEACGGETEHLHELPELTTVHRALTGAGFLQVELQRQELVEYHTGVAELLRSLKRIGAGNASSRAPRGLASRRLLQSMTDIYRQRYAQDGQIPASYEVIYGLAVAPPR